MPIKNYTTKINTHRTVAEIQLTLAEKGAQTVTIEYGTGGKVNAVLFSLVIAGQIIPFRLPSRPEGVLAALKKQRVPYALQTIQHAESVSWRIVKDWIEAQCALVESQQAQMGEVFLPYCTPWNGKRTMFEVFEQQAIKGLLGTGEASPIEGTSE